MFYLIRNEQIRAAETYDRAARLVAEGWELTTLATYRAQWQAQDAERAQQLRPAVPLLEKEV